MRCLWWCDTCSQAKVAVPTFQRSLTVLVMLRRVSKEYYPPSPPTLPTPSKKNVTLQCYDSYTTIKNFIQNSEKTNFNSSQNYMTVRIKTSIKNSHLPHEFKFPIRRNKGYGVFCLKLGKLHTLVELTIINSNARLPRPL